MSVAELLAANYSWADAHAWSLLAVALAVPVLGTALTWLAGLGRSLRPGRRVASVCVGFGLAAVAFEAAAILVAHYLLGHSVVDANVILLVAPLVCLAASIGGIGLLLPVSELASVRAACDVGLFVLAGAVALWLISKFRGWGFIFFGSIGEFIVIGLLCVGLLRKLYRRAFVERAPAPPSWTSA